MLKVLFDNCTPSPLKREFGKGIKVTEARAVGLAEVYNSLLELTAHKLGYDALITVDTDFGKPEHIAEYNIPVVLLRAVPSVVVSTLSVLVPIAERSLLSGISPGVYVWDNYEGTILFSRSFAKSEELREELEAERKTAKSL